MGYDKSNYFDYDIILKINVFFLIPTETYDWKKCLRFSLYGGLFVAPTLYCWIRVSSIIWPTTSFKTAIYKVAIVKK